MPRAVKHLTKTAPISASGAASMSPMTQSSKTNQLSQRPKPHPLLLLLLHDTLNPVLCPLSRQDRRSHSRNRRHQRYRGHRSRSETRCRLRRSPAEVPRRPRRKMRRRPAALRRLHQRLLLRPHLPLQRRQSVRLSTTNCYAPRKSRRCSTVKRAIRKNISTGHRLRRLPARCERR